MAPDAPLEEPRTIKFAQGFALDFSRQQTSAIVDNSITLALHFDDSEFLACVEVMERIDEMDMVGVVSRPASEAGRIQILNRKGCDMQFTARVRLDSGRRLVEVILGDSAPEVAVSYSDVVHFEIGSEGKLVRIVVDLRCINETTLLFDGETLDS